MRLVLILTLYLLAFGSIFLITHERSESKKLQLRLEKQLERAWGKCTPEVGRFPLLFSVQQEGELKCVYNFHRPAPLLAQKQYEEILHNAKQNRRNSNGNSR